MAYRKKAEFILSYKPDIIVIPECEHPDKLIFKNGITPPNDILWYGTNQNKGLGVFSYGNFKFELLNVHNPEIKTVLPIAVTNGKIEFVLFAIWAYNSSDPGYNYIGQVWKAIEYYQEI